LRDFNLAKTISSFEQEIPQY